MKDRFGAYKKAVKEKYENEKLGDFANYLLAPTDAKLRKLCEIRFRENTSENDHAIFERFIGFPFVGNSKKLVKQTESFRTIKKFLKGESILTDENAADMLAVIVDYQSRPFHHFVRSAQERESPGPVGNPLLTTVADDPLKTKTEDLPETTPKESEEDKTTNRFWDKSKKYIAILFLITTTAILVQLLNRQPKCLTWNNDHYELVNCEGNYPIVPYRKELLEFRKIVVSDTTTFFKNGQPVVWYSKQNNDYEFFNAPGANPTTGKSLKPISRHIIENGILKK